MISRVVASWEARGCQNAPQLVARSFFTKGLRLLGHKNAVHLQLRSRKGHFSTFLHKKRSRCVTLLGCGHLGDSELKECTVIYCTKPPYKSAEAPRSQKVVALATLKQKKAPFSTFFTKERSRCVTLLGCGHLGDSEFKECTVVCCTEPPYKSAEAPRSQEVVTLATLKQKKALFLLFYKKKRSSCVTLLGCGHLGDSEFKECTVSYCTEPPYKSAEAPRFQKDVTLATPKQKKALFLVFYKNKGPGVSLCWVVGTWETQSLKNAQSFTLQSHLTKVLRLPGLKKVLHLQL